MSPSAPLVGLPLPSLGSVEDTLCAMGATYLNTDLDLRARFDPTTLHRELVDAGLDPAAPRLERGVWWSSYNAPRHGHPAEAICLMLDVVERLSSDGRRLWNACVSRRFNVGYECCDDAFYSVWQATPKLLRRMAEAEAAFVVTIYRSSELVGESAPESSMLE